MPKVKSEYHHGDLKQALLQAALQALGREGHNGLSLRKLASSAGVSSAALYRHYKDLEALFADLAKEGFHRLRAELQRTRARFGKNALLQFRAAGVAYVEFALREPDLFQIMYGSAIADHSLHPTLIHAEEEAFAVLRAIMGDCQHAGSLRQGDIMQMATAAWVMVHGMANLLLGNQVMLRNLGRRRARDMTKRMIENLYVGLK